MEKTAEKYLQSIGLENIIGEEFFNDDDKSYYTVQELMEGFAKQLKNHGVIGDVSGRTMSLDVAMSTLKSMPYDQANQVLKSDLTNKPETVEIDGHIRLVYVR
jgi:hypothetical protein